MDVALVSCKLLPEPDPDAAPLTRALADAGISSEVVAWDDPQADATRGRLAVLRSCWNYPQHLAAFLAWAERTAAATELWNPFPVVRWNTHKGYLLELARNGLPVVPTVLVRRAERAALGEIMEERGWDAAVVKPAVSAASFRTRRFEREQRSAGQAHLERLSAEGDVLVQRYLHAVEGHGERALVWIDGELTHAVRKSPRFEGQDEHVSPHALPVSAAESSLARRAIEAVDARLLYARIDVAPGPDGAPLIMELELVEPSLFFAQGPAALARLVAAIGRRLG